MFSFCLLVSLFHFLVCLIPKCCFAVMLKRPEEPENHQENLNHYVDEWPLMPKRQANQQLGERDRIKNHRILAIQSLNNVLSGDQIVVMICRETHSENTQKAQLEVQEPRIFLRTSPGTFGWSLERPQVETRKGAS